MWIYEKKLEFPVKIKRPNPKMAKYIITQYGGPDGELAAALRYLSQRFSMVTPQAKATLNDIGTEELAHLEMIGSIVKQLTENASIDEIKKADLGGYFSDHDKAVYPVNASGVPFTAAYIQSKGDPITDLYEDMAAEQKARSTYEYLMTLADDPDVIEPLKFLREREVVHFQRFGEALRIVQDYMGSQKQYSVKMPENMNPNEGVLGTRMKSNEGVLGTGMANPNEGVLGTGMKNPNEGVLGSRMTNPNEGVLGSRMANPNEGVLGTGMKSPNEGMLGSRMANPNEGVLGTGMKNPNEGMLGSRMANPNEGVLGTGMKNPNEGVLGTGMKNPNDGVLGSRMAKPSDVLDTKMRDMKMNESMYDARLREMRMRMHDYQ